MTTENLSSMNITRWLDSTPTTASPVAIWTLIVGTLTILFLIIVLVEATVMQFLSWGNLRQSLIGALIMNLPSSIMMFGLLAFIKPHWAALVMAFLASVAVEGGILRLLKHDNPHLNNWTAVLANLASYLLLMGPALLIVH